MFLGLRTTLYPAPDLAAATAWFSDVLGFGPYFEQPEYVGFDVGGYELGLDPSADPAQGVLSYWGVTDVDTALAHLLGHGATVHLPVQDVGDRIRLATVIGPAGELIGIIENPHFAARH